MTSAYETLFTNLKKTFTVTSDNCEYTLGEYMLKKANAKKENSALPVARTSSNEGNSIYAIFSYVNDKLTVKKAPEKDKTIRAFPFRTSVAAFMSAVVACALIFSFGFFATQRGNQLPTAEANDDIQTSEIYDAEIYGIK